MTKLFCKAKWAKEDTGCLNCDDGEVSQTEETYQRILGAGRAFFPTNTSCIEFRPVAEVVDEIDHASDIGNVSALCDFGILLAVIYLHSHN